MRVTEIIVEDQMDEVFGNPYGLGKQVVDKLGSMVGREKSSASLDVGQRANEISKTFKKWAYRSGVELDQVTNDDINTWLRSQRLPDIDLTQITGLQPTDPFNIEDPKLSKEIWMKISKEAFKQGRQPGGQLGTSYGTQTTSGAAATANFNQIKNALASLTPQQKSALKGML
jgi:hypothetical protein